MITITFSQDKTESVPVVKSQQVTSPDGSRLITITVPVKSEGSYALDVTISSLDTGETRDYSFTLENT
jgi:hypothetical protein